MMRMDGNRCLWLAALAALLVAGCAVAPSGERTAGPFSGPEAPAGQMIPGQRAVPAIVALVDSADAKEQAGAYEQAAAALERALRLAPRNAMLWHRLARLRMKQGQWQNAVDLAAKSNSLAGGDADLQSWNWAVIAQAREQLGDKKGAAEARARVGGASGVPSSVVP